jgi:hypothetical protein
MFRKKGLNSSSGVPPWQDKEDDKDTSHKIKRMATDLLGASSTFFTMTV